MLCLSSHMVAFQLFELNCCVARKVNLEHKKTQLKEQELHVLVISVPIAVNWTQFATLHRLLRNRLYCAQHYASPRLKLKPQFTDWVKVNAFSVFRSRRVVSIMLHASHVWFPEVQGCSSWRRAYMLRNVPYKSIVLRTTYCCSVEQYRCT
jgi:hypothetical protein